MNDDVTEKIKKHNKAIKEVGQYGKHPDLLKKAPPGHKLDKHGAITKALDTDVAVNEMDDGYANGDFKSMEPPVVTQLVPPVSTETEHPDDSIVIGTPDHGAQDPKNVTVSAVSINPVSYSGDDPIAAFDVVFSVSCSCPQSGNTKTYQVVKRIGVDRLKLSKEAEGTTPISVVEAKKPVDAFFSTKRFKQLAGLKG